jgi:hypothetical protein
VYPPSVELNLFAATKSAEDFFNGGISSGGTLFHLDPLLGALGDAGHTPEAELLVEHGAAAV